MSFTPPPDILPKVYTIASDLPRPGKQWDSLTAAEQRAVHDVTRRLGDLLAPYLGGPKS